MKRKKNKSILKEDVIYSSKVQAFLERSIGVINNQLFRSKYIQLSLIFKSYNIDVSYFNDFICIRFDDYLGYNYLKQILRLFPYDSFSHNIYSNGTYTISPLK